MDTYVVDTSVLASGALGRLIQEGGLAHSRILVPTAVLQQLEAWAQDGRETGFTGLDEVSFLHDLSASADLKVEFAPAAAAGLIQALAELCQESGGTLLTQDRAVEHAARARAVKTRWLGGQRLARADAAEAEHGGLDEFFDDETMSVHLKEGCAPIAKRGRPGAVRVEPIGGQRLERKEMSRLAREIVEAARGSPNGFVEIEREGAVVVQLGTFRVAIARPPFSDALEITAVRPLRKVPLEEWNLPDDILPRIVDAQRGVFISGPPGSGKSTLVAALAEYLAGSGKIVKTMESPRDLQVPEEVTQYAPLEGKMELTADVLLLVRPDYVLYDELRRTEDFRIFADMRLAGVGLVGVTHANRAIDAVQRLLGRVDLGLIPQVVDTIIHVRDGAVEEILELRLTVKVPQGMVEADLARPVVVVSDLATGRVTHEMYTYGEQVVVMPVEEGTVAKRDQLAAAGLERSLKRHVSGDHRVEFVGPESAIVYVEPWEVPMLIGRGGERVKELERELGVHLEIKAFERQAAAEKRRDRYAQLRPDVRRTKKHLVLLLEAQLHGHRVEVCIGEEVLFEATIGSKGEIRVRRNTDEGRALDDALLSDEPVRVRV